MLKLKLQYFGHLMRTDSLEKTLTTWDSRPLSVHLLLDQHLSHLHSHEPLALCLS